METTYLSILMFIIITIIYYSFPVIGKVPMTLEYLNGNPEEGKTIESLYYTNYLRLAIYLVAVFLSQFLINSVFIMQTCGGDTVSNIGTSFLMTFFPWVFIFGFILVVLIINPGFKSAFSDIVGYFVVAGSATELLNKILIDPTISNSIDNSTETDVTKKNDLKLTAQSVLKLISNNSILINQITPANFLESWTKLKPLMKDETTFTNTGFQEELLNIAIMRDNIGEAMWYLYTAIVIISVVAYKLSSSACEQNMFDIEMQSKKRLNDLSKKVTNVSGNVANTAQNVSGNVANRAENVSGNAVNRGQNISGNVANNAQNLSGNVANNAQNLSGNVANGAQNLSGNVANNAQNLSQNRPNVM
jgi:hypothetical protein